MTVRITADDLGYSVDTSNAILTALKSGIITHASLMANMPGFEHACDLVAQNKIEGAIGLHVNLSEGRPLTEQLRLSPRFCNANGAFIGRVGNVIWLPDEEREAVGQEIEAQFERCRAQGIALSHIDSHHHFHTEPAILPLVMQLARRTGIRHVRLSRNCGPGIPLLKSIYKRLANGRLRAEGLSSGCWFGSIQDVLTLPRGTSGGVEVMVHPVWGTRGDLIDATDDQALTPGRIRAVRDQLELAES